MKEIRIKSFTEFHETLEPYQRSNLWLFRGHSNPEWELIPKAGRQPYINSNDEVNFNGWLRRAVEFTDLSKLDMWDSLAVAQHHGLATRLLDWSYNALSAAFFAVSEGHETDAVVFAYYSKWYVRRDEATPFEYEGVIRFKPKGVAQRITRQGGIFTVHSPPDLSLNRGLRPEDTLEKLIIDKSYTKQLSFDLSFYGINKMTLFPDLDGLAAHINWAAANRNFWAEAGEEQANKD
ncbi:MAG TPA: FRG domain-containing protein [Pyrinomonadaceae bacterium]